MSETSDPTSLERLASQLTEMERDIRHLKNRIQRLENDDELTAKLLDVPRFNENLPGLYRKLQQARKELAELLGKGVLPEGLGDDAAEDVEIQDKDTEGFNALMRVVRAEIIKKARPDVGRDPALDPEEVEDDWARNVGDKKT